MDLLQRLSALPESSFYSENILFRRISSDDDLAVATDELTLPPEQQELVNPIGFSLGRAYLFPDDNVPYIIYALDKLDASKELPIGFIMLRVTYKTEDTRSWNRFVTHSPRTNFSYYIIPAFQGRGYGIAAARLAIDLLTKVFPEYPIELTTEKVNVKAQRLYEKLGFRKTDELDGDDYVFLYNVKQ